MDKNSNGEGAGEEGDKENHHALEEGLSNSSGSGKGRLLLWAVTSTPSGKKAKTSGNSLAASGDVPRRSTSAEERGFGR
jgi:hypothetical protein